MAEKGSHKIRNSVISTVVGGIVLSLWEPIRNWLLETLTWVWTLVKTVWGLAVSSYSIPGWALIILFVGLIPAFAIVVRSITTKRELGALDLYKSDELFGATWRWDYAGTEILNLWCLCTSCQMELVYQEHIKSPLLSHYDNDDDNTRFICERCNQVRVKLTGAKNYALGTVEREIRRKLRTGEWKKSVSANRDINPDAS
jgi:hypothetical protein